MAEAGDLRELRRFPGEAFGEVFARLPLRHRPEPMAGERLAARPGSGFGM